MHRASQPSAELLNLFLKAVNFIVQEDVGLANRAEGLLRIPEFVFQMLDLGALKLDLGFVVLSVDGIHKVQALFNHRVRNRRLLKRHALFCGFLKNERRLALARGALGALVLEDNPPPRVVVDDARLLLGVCNALLEVGRGAGLVPLLKMDIDTVILVSVGVLLQNAVNALDIAKAEDIEDFRDALLSNVGENPGNKEGERLINGRHFALRDWFLRNDLLYQSL